MNKHLNIKTICFVGLAYILCFQVKAQGVDFLFNEELNTLMTQKEGGSPYTFEIISVVYTTVGEKPTTKRLTTFYKKALAFTNKAKADSTRIANLNKESKLTPAVKKEITDVNNRLRIARRTLKSVKKYEIVPSQVSVGKYNKYKIRRSVFKPENIFVGAFKNLGSFYVTKSIDGYNERDLISVANAKSNNLTSEYFLFENQFVLIENIQTKVVYMVYPDFLEKYAINKIAAQEKYKGKISLPKKEYIHDYDKKIDSIIIDYNYKEYSRSINIKNKL
ncbi:hypothetical protein SAMN04489722_102205 [Algibacter lectus]|uniref:hypothetical protein n=1 Tax=Algibacter lectus TaxID=221126 RepID=UPI0008EC29CB|nr:hypothetical protein [Algibacter lectus]SFC32545.1 hypothetical protein SAMN04489722_102205 [Algibacter lectus]